MGQRNPETFTTALCEEIKKRSMQLQANNEQDRIMDPESMTHSPVQGTVCVYLLQGEGTRERERLEGVYRRYIS